MIKTARILNCIVDWGACHARVGLARGLVLDELDSEEEAHPSHVAHVLMLWQRFGLDQGLGVRTHLGKVCEWRCEGMPLQSITAAEADSSRGSSTRMRSKKVRFHLTAAAFSIRPSTA